MKRRYSLKSNRRIRLSFSCESVQDFAMEVTVKQIRDGVLVKDLFHQAANYLLNELEKMGGVCYEAVGQQFPGKEYEFWHTKDFNMQLMLMP